MSTSVFNIVLATTGGAAVINALEGVRGALGGVASTAFGATSLLAGVKQGLDLGGQLNDLSARTGQSVRDLVVFRRALDNAGVGGDSAAQYIGLLQKAIAGLNEEGGKTDDVFKKLGLDPEALKRLGVGAQFEAISAGFGKIANPAERAALAMGLFGRNGAAMLQLLGDTTAMSTAADESGRLAQRLQETNARLDAAGDKLSLVKVRLNEFWVVAAEKALPTLVKMAEVLERLNPAPLAAAAGNIVAIFGAISGAALINRLDTAVLEWATKPGVNVAGQAFAGRFLAPMTGALAKVLPVGLAAVIAVEVAKGIVAGVAEWRNGQLDGANAGFDRVASLGNQTRDVGSLEDRQRVMAALETQLGRVQSALDTERARWWQNDQAIASYSQQIAQLRAMLGLLNSSWAENQIAHNRAAADAAKNARAQAQAAAWLKSDAAAALRDQVAEGITGRRDPAEQLANLQAFLAVQQRVIAIAAAERAAGRNDAVNQQNALKATAERERILKEIAATEQLIATTSASKTEEALNSRLLQLAQRRAQVEGDFSRTEASKYRERLRFIAEEIALRNRRADALQAQHDATQDPAARATLASGIRGELGSIGGLQEQRAQLGPDPSSWLQQSMAALTELQNGWGTTSEQIGQSIRGQIGGAVSSVSTNLTQWVIRAQSGRQAFDAIKVSIGTGIIGAIVDMGVKWIANLGIMAAKWLATKLGIFAAEKGLAAAATAALLPLAAAQSAVWAAPATLATIASFGGAAVQAPLSIAGAIGTTQALALIPGFLGGGLVTGSEQLVRMNEDGRPEYVFSGPAVAALGVDTLDALHAAARSGDTGALASAFPARSGGGGDSGAGATPPPNVTLINVASDREATRIARRSRAAGDVVQIVRENWSEITRRGAR